MCIPKLYFITFGVNAYSRLHITISFPFEIVSSTDLIIVEDGGRLGA